MALGARLAVNSRLFLNHGTVQAFLDGKYGVEAMLEKHAQNVLSAAQADPHDLTGAYEASLHIETEHTDRMVKRVVSDSPYAWVVEANHGVLSRALDHA